MILAGDIGGTNSRLLLAQAEAGKITIIKQQTFASQDYPGLLPVVQTFLHDHPDTAAGIHSACFAVAGPISGDTANITNLPWRLDAAVLAQALKIQHVQLINDFAGLAHGLEQLSPAELLVLNQAEAAALGTRLVLGAGTGLGAAALVPHDKHYTVVATEAGHMDFPPRDADELALFRYWQQRLPRVSYETFLSGAGLQRIYQFNAAAHHTAVDEILNSPDPAEISAAGLHATDALAVKTLDQFIRIYAACAGNLALAFKATGGVYIAGGIAPRLADKIRHSDFMRIFCDKGPMSTLLQSMPVSLVLNTQVGLLGAAVVASRAI